MKRRQDGGHDLDFAILIQLQTAMASPEKNIWGHVGLQNSDKTRCLEAVRKRYAGYQVEEFEHQGHCSFTILLTPQRDDIKSHCSVLSEQYEARSGVETQLLIQIRPLRYALDLDMALAARRIHSHLASMVRVVDIDMQESLQAYEMNKLEGTPFSRLSLNGSLPTVDVQRKQETLITSLATILAQSWPVDDSRKRRDSFLRPDSPPNSQHPLLSRCTGKVGSQLTQKLNKLAEELPDHWLRARAKLTLEKLHEIDDYPVVLNHGDLIPSNILVNEETWEITGLVDWAEAEWLPFGTCLYSLEYLLGSLQMVPHEKLAFVYYDNALLLRERFCTTLLVEAPELGFRANQLQVMRDTGVLLWHGYAWDEGAIDRVVNEADDGEELAKLRAFLSV
ncbi:hypothetical protein OPT61_g9250 [Boeremia exigua]|uniref:Uncharacterized protein n=1 Tax=Boeremia exigua TaxID=749465 RepID=A0ACC2HVF5_9PLEO|nr:hypothetical protein OPT61_g9250 [Boeremia exigua]